MMINDSDDDNSASNNVVETEAWYIEDENASNDDDYDYDIAGNNNRHPPVNNNSNNRRTIVDISEDQIQQNQQARANFIRVTSLLLSDGNGLPVFHYTRQVVFGGVGWLRSLAQRSFDALSQNAQNLVGYLNPGQACVVYLSSDIVTLYHANGHVHFTEDDIAGLIRQDIKNCGALPIVKTLTKNMGANSLENTIGGGNKKYSYLNETTPTLLRSGVFVGFLHDENFDAWDEIRMDPDSERKLVAAKEEASKRHHRGLADFSIYSAEYPRVLLKKVNGICPLSQTVGGMGSSNELPNNTDRVLAKIDEAGGGLYHRKISDTEKAFYICITPEDCTESPVANAETHLSELMDRVNAYHSQNRSRLPDFHWLIYPPMDNDPSRMGPSHLGHGKGTATLKKKLGALTGKSVHTFNKNWRKSPDGVKLAGVALSQQMWLTHKNTDGTLYNSQANMWVKVVSTEREHLGLVGN